MGSGCAVFGLCGDDVLSEEGEGGLSEILEAVCRRCGAAYYNRCRCLPLEEGFGGRATADVEDCLYGSAGHDWCGLGERGGSIR